MGKHYVAKCFGAVILTVFLVGTVSAESQHADKARPSIADHVPPIPTHDHVDEGWLADLTGLPNIREVERLTRHVIMVMREEDEKTCFTIDQRLRKMIFVHFAIYQHMANKQGIYLNDQIVHQWAHVFGMLLKESSGDTTNITSMTGRSVASSTESPTLEQWKKIAHLSRQGIVPLNYQTNFGLTQLSDDRLFTAFQLAKQRRELISFLEGKQGAETSDTVKLDTAIAIRRLIWFYQDIAQGRLRQAEKRLEPTELYKGENFIRRKLGVDLALLYCGTQYMFKEGFTWNEEGKAALKNAMASIAYCKLGNAQAGYGKDEMDEKCFAEWVTLCPTLNFDIALLTPLSYFATRDAAPVCERTFKRLLIKEREPEATHHVEHKPPHEPRLGSAVRHLLKSTSTILYDIIRAPFEGH